MNISAAQLLWFQHSTWASHRLSLSLSLSLSLLTADEIDLFAHKHTLPSTSPMVECAEFQICHGEEGNLEQELIALTMPLGSR